MSKARKQPAVSINLSSATPDLLLEAETLLENLTLGVWSPSVDLCETSESYTVRVELPGVDLRDISLTIQDGILRVSGIKREPAASSRLLCYYCLERRYGKFHREISLESVIDAQRAAAILDNGILTVELPKLVERRGLIIEVPITRQAG